MFLTIIIVLTVFVCLIVLHELGHFILAKKFGVKVEEFGIGIPPRLWGKKFGETLYSINLLPFGGFVKIRGEDERVKEEGSFSEKPIWQRGLIILGGIFSFWLVGFLIFSLVVGIWGIAETIPDDVAAPANVQIIQVLKNSPAKISGLKTGDKIVAFKEFTDLDFSKTNKVKEVQEFIKTHLEQKIILKIKRGEKIFDFVLTPQTLSLKGEGAIGIGLVRVTPVKRAAWYEAPIKGFLITLKATVQIPQTFLEFLKQTFQGKKIEGAEVVGPIGIAVLLGQVLEIGLDKFLFFVGMMSLWLAWINILPLPALDGGRLLFLAIEAVVRRAKKQTFQTFQAIEQKITAFFFFFLLLLIILVTIKDISNLFSS